MKISRAKLRVVLLLLIGVTLAALAAGVCMSVGIHWSPRYQVLEPHQRRFAPRGEFEQFVREHNLPYEIESGEGIDTILIPLDGTRSGQHFRARFYADGTLRDASAIDREGRWTGFYIGVRR